MLAFFADFSGFTQVSNVQKVSKAASRRGVGGEAEKWAGRVPVGADSGRERGGLGVCVQNRLSLALYLYGSGEGGGLQAGAAPEVNNPGKGVRRVAVLGQKCSTEALTDTA